MVVLPCPAIAQNITISGPGDRFAPMDAVQNSRMDFNLFLLGSRDSHTTDLQSPSGSVSKLDLKAPGKARREYEQGYQRLMRRDLEIAIEHLAKSIAVYPQFVAAHNALGTAYLDQGQNDLAHAQFAQAVALDDHLPNSYLNLGCAELALKQYPAAEESLRKASSLAPLDIQLQLALAYSEFVNQDYPALLATTRGVHEKKHEGASVVHLFAAGAWEAQGNLSEARREMETLLNEDPKSASADRFRRLLEEIKTQQARREEAKVHPVQRVTVVSRVPAGPTPEQAERQRQLLRQQEKQQSQIADAEAAPDPTCVDCGATIGVESLSDHASASGAKEPGGTSPRPTFRMSVDEVSLFFAATDHSKSVTDLAASDVVIRDDRQPPSAILGFRNESQLPLRLGLVIDTSESITGRFAFEQAAAARFLQDVVAGKDDLAFVVGVNNSVLLVQDFTPDQALTSRAVNQLAPGGGTALWDAVAFAADKLAAHPEVQPVARILVVISDGKDNSSATTLKQAIARAQRGEVAIYTVSSQDERQDDPGTLLGQHALKTLSELTGGTPFAPGSVRHLDHSLADVQQVIRGRYLVSYKPASFQRDDRYRTIDIAAQKDGRKLTVFARKGYYAAAPQPASDER